MNGLVNPADLFTKHLSSSDRVGQLTELFNCEYRGGRAESAPDLRKDRPLNLIQAGSDITDVNNASEMHDPSFLPHDFLSEDIERMFPKAEAPPDLDFSSYCQCMCCRPECRICFPVQVDEFKQVSSHAEAWIVNGESSKWPRRRDAPESAGGHDSHTSRIDHKRERSSQGSDDVGGAYERTRHPVHQPSFYMSEHRANRHVAESRIDEKIGRFDEELRRETKPPVALPRQLSRMARSL